MNQRELDRAVARATGETIQRVGFLLAPPQAESVDPEDDQFGPYIIDWDELAAPRNRPLTRPIAVGIRALSPRGALDVWPVHSTFEKVPMRVLVINNDGGGFADYLEIEEGTTVRQLFERQVRSPQPENYLIRVNRQPVPSDRSLHEGDRISVTPVKIEGA